MEFKFSSINNFFVYVCLFWLYLTKKKIYENEESMNIFKIKELEAFVTTLLILTLKNTFFFSRVSFCIILLVKGYFYSY